MKGFNILSPLTLTRFPDNNQHRPDILDITLVKGVALRLRGIETLQRLDFDYCFVLLKLGLLTGDRLNPVKTITNWKKILVALEKIDTPALSDVPNDIVYIDEFDYGIGTRAHVVKYTNSIPLTGFGRPNTRYQINQTHQSGSASRLHALALLYSAYTDDIPRPQTGVQLVLFVDDTTLYLRSCSVGHIIPRLQRTIDELTQWFQLWRIEVNPEKSGAIYFDYSMKKEDSNRPEIISDVLGSLLNSTSDALAGIQADPPQESHAPTASIFRSVVSDKAEDSPWVDT
ncbi:hypothetical protein EVAR_19795_1 [Eumeta japonica]|uniref:Uncharacterized protein n=1 Tax=Eumeta variegata TaxID=151549 RepID=A0A4C1UQK3_EUMVA|nr:hypothetical protein EVAR_19795_1 [Eumeta japonica]